MVYWLHTWMYDAEAIKGIYAIKCEIYVFIAMCLRITTTSWGSFFKRYIWACSWVISICFSENYRLHFINAQTASACCWASFSTVAQRIGIKDAVCWIWKRALINPGLDCSQYWWGGGARNPKTPHGCEDWLPNTVLITSRGKTQKYYNQGRDNPLMWPLMDIRISVKR